ncbi:MAG: RNA-binding S4 domain-containing protein [Rhodospirillaceae bacterium]|nr:RNA-binding S4 domain-containing protein [Rhodospirillaceae bacterium]
MNADRPAPAPGIRLDKWLWFARFCKTRALAQKMIEHGQVTVDGVVANRPSATVRPGQALAITLGPVRRAVIVAATGVRRGPPTEAQALYTEHAAQRLPRDQAGLPPHKLRRQRR